MSIRISLLAACIAAACACDRAAAQTPTPAPAPPPADSAAPPATIPARRVPRNQNVITATELEGQAPTNAYELIRRLRPRWIPLYAVEYAGHDEELWVYLDGNRMGHVSELGQISSISIGEIRYVPGREAVQRWGPGYGGGAILITTR